MEQGDAISRSAVLDAMPKDTELLRHQVVDAICNTPALDVASVVHAMWIEDDLGNHRCSNCVSRIPYYHCYSEVSCEEWDEEINLTRCCPHCGAKMDGEDDDHETD